MSKCYIIFEVTNNEEENIPVLVALDRESAIEEWQKIIDSGKKAIIKPVKRVGKIYNSIEGNF